MEYIYGGANGGSGENKWYTEDILKLGTQSVSGSFTLELTEEVNAVVLTGYVQNAACVIEVGDSESNNKTKYTCSDMAVTTKDIVNNKLTTSIVVEFENTSSVKIATTNNKPFYITSIEFIKN